jgi:hypothetical protein
MVAQIRSGVLNDIEIVWGDLKARHLAHRTFIDLDSLDSTIHHAVADLNSARNRDPLDRRRISALGLRRPRAARKLTITRIRRSSSAQIRSASCAQ